MAKAGEDDKQQPKVRLFSLIFTHFTDDYKPRNGDWSDSEGPYLYTNRGLAEAYLMYRLVRFIEQEERDYLVEKYPRNFKKNGKLTKKARNDLEALEEMAEVAAKGEYVPSVWSWELSEVATDTRLAPKDVGSDDTSGSDNDSGSGSGSDAEADSEKSNDGEVCSKKAEDDKEKDEPHKTGVKRPAQTQSDAKEADGDGKRPSPQKKLKSK